MKRNYIYLWSLLVCSFLIFFTISAYQGEIKVGEYTVKPSDLAQPFLSYIYPDSLSDESADSLLALEALDIAATPDTVALDTLPKTILFFGDSMLEGLYPRLAAYCETSGHKLYAVIWYSSTSEIWGNVNLITKYIEKLNPNYIFISLGANELNITDIAEKRDKYVKHILAEIGDIPYLWIGPPNWKEDTGINDLIAANTPKGCFFLSNGMQFKRKKDGAHPTKESAIEWMDSIIRWMPDNCAHPILLNPPIAETARAERTFTHQPGPNP